MIKYIKKAFIFLIIATLLVLAFVSSNLKALEEKTVVDGAYYKVEESIEDIDLEYGLANVKYLHEKAFTAITSASRLIGNECGGALYGSGSLDLNREYSQNAHILKIPKDAGVEIVAWSVIKDGHWSLSTILETASDYEQKHPGYKVIAGVNGDFFDISADDPYPYTVLGTMVASGDVLKVESTWPAVNFKNDGSNTPLIKVDTPTYSIMPKLYIYSDNGSVESYEISKVNEEISNASDIGLYFGTYEKQDKNHSCIFVDVSDAYIVDNENVVSVAYSNMSYYGKGYITKYGNATLKDNSFAIKTSNPELIEKLREGTLIKVEHELLGELQGANNVSGAVATFLKDSKHAELDNYDYMQYRYPRTLAGYTKDGEVILAVTDGRQASKGYYGLNGVESAAQMLHYGCVEAFSFDGGGSSTMVILEDGKLKCVNSPSDGGLRRDGNAILIVARVPSLEIDYTSKPDEITLMVKELEKLSGFDNYYVSLDGKMLALIDSKATFTNLEANKAYSYQLYVKKGDHLSKMPYSEDVYTQKEMFEVNGITLALENDEYILNLDLTDDDICIITAVFLINGVRISHKKNRYTIPKEIIDGLLSNSNESYLLINYQLSINDEREEAQISLDKLGFSDASVALSSITDTITDIISSYLD